MFQHPTADNKGESHDIMVTETSSTSKAIDNLQESRLSHFWFSHHLLPKYHLKMATLQESDCLYQMLFKVKEDA